MDLIYVRDGIEMGVLQQFKLDMAIGRDENNFQIKTHLLNCALIHDDLIYIEDTEYGGIVRSIKVNTGTNEIVYEGDTFQGILDSRIVEPPHNEDYLVVEGNVSTIINFWLKKYNFNDLFICELTNYSTKAVSINRYASLREAIMQLLRMNKLKPTYVYQKQKIHIVIKEIVDYTDNEEFTSDNINMEVYQVSNRYNHCLCLGKGELKNRTIINIYIDDNGNILDTPNSNNIRSIKYENVNIESLEELKKEGLKKLFATKKQNFISLKLNERSNKYDVGDIIAARENTTKIFVKKEITKKIINISDNTLKIRYEAK